MVRTVIARRDPRLRAAVVREQTLRFVDGSGRRAAVRAGSSLAWFGARLAVVQDDAVHVALIDPADGSVDAIRIPGVDAGRGKLDLEACVTLPTRAGDVLAMLSSGSWEPPWCIATLRDPLRPRAALHPGGDFYAALHAATDFTGGALNIEGAVVAGSRLRLLNRGGRGGANASMDIPMTAFARFLAGAPAPLPPDPATIVRYDLGGLDGVALGFTDIAPAGAGGMFYVASAEDSAGAALDGHVTGSVIGVIRRGHARWAEIRHADGSAYPAKVEGICPDRTNARRAWLVTDPDDPGAPARLCEAELSGPW